MTAIDEPAREDPAAQRVKAQVVLRTEDLSQDGRLFLVALPNVLAETVWRRLLIDHPAQKALLEQGIVPIFSRLVLEGGGGGLSASRPLEAEGSYELAHSRGEDGGVERLYFNVLAVAHEEGRPAGRIFAEHVLTRLFAPPEARRVRRLEGVPGVPEVPPTEYRSSAPRDLLTLPPGAKPLDDNRHDGQVWRVAEPPILFGLCHTDSNQHVNSIVYPRMFEEAALRALADAGKTSLVLARHCEVAFRKPFFAGDRARILLQPFELDGRLGVTGAFVSEEDAAARETSRAHAYVRMLFQP